MNDGDFVIYTILLHVLGRRRPGDLIVDVGACDAAFSLVCARNASPIYAFEPNKKSYFAIMDYLKKILWKLSMYFRSQFPHEIEKLS